MRHVHDLSSINLDGCRLTIGSFDGVHRGHQALIKGMVSDTHAMDLPVVVLTFYPHPSVVLRGRRPTFYITSPDEKAALLGELGVDWVITQRFDKELSQMSASSFITLLQTHLAFRQLWVGEDFSLGHRREGNRHFLEKISADRGFQLHLVSPILSEGEAISSTRIREALRAGDVARVTSYLGREYTIPGKVVKGAGRGKQLEIPTANLEIWEDRASPKPGVYACFADVDEDCWKAVSNIGVRPTFEDGSEGFTIEVHLLNFHGDLYDREINLVFIHRLRDEQRFESVEALQNQIEIDIQKAHAILDERLEHRNA